MPGTELVTTSIPVTGAADWEARAAFWANRVLYWAFEPYSYRNREFTLENAITGMRDAQATAARIRKYESREI